VALDDFNANAHGVMGDALVELGRYDEAFVQIQRMVDLRPDLSSYARVSYARELQGDVVGAAETCDWPSTPPRPSPTGLGR
jgi:hypothetical protein